VRKHLVKVNYRIYIALEALWANKLRSALALLGMAIGVAAVIAVVSLIDGINAFVAKRVFDLGADVFIVSKSPNVVLNVSQFVDSLRRKDITLEAYKTVAENCRSCQFVGAEYNNFFGHVRVGQQSSADTIVRGWTPDMGTIYDLELIAGRSITDLDIQSNAKVAIIGYDVFNNLLPDADPIGKEIRVDGDKFTVIGLGKKEGKTLGFSRDNWVVMPISVWQMKYGTRGHSVRIWVKANGVAALGSCLDETRGIMRMRRHDGPGLPDSFELETNSTFLDLWSNLSTTIFAATLALVSTSLIIAGIVMMNIMLVSVTERSYEIGVRKAAGASKRDILMQFLIESVLMALLGGLAGIALGIFAAISLSVLLGMPSEIKAWSIFIGIFVSASCGVFFGVYPAKQAA